MSRSFTKRRGQEAEFVPIGELSRLTGCNIETIRYYEKIGVVVPPVRTEGGHRIYGADHVQRLSFVRRARELGFTLDAVRALLRLAMGGQGACAEARGVAAAHLAEVRAKLADLQAMEQVLAEAVCRCEAGETSGCPLISTLSSGPKLA